MSLGAGNIQRLIKKFKKFPERNFLKAFSGVFKNPICCLGVIVLCSIFFLKYPSFKEDYFFLPSCLETSQNAFLKQEKVTFLKASQSIVIEENSFKEAVPVTIFKTNVLGTLTKETPEREEIIEYTVEEGDTLSQIAQKFGISLETVLWANNLSKSSKIQPGQELTILPVSGVMHLVKEGETVLGIAKKYQADASEIADFNRLSEKAEVFVGDILVVPGGVMAPESSIEYATQYTTPLASSFFICPIPSPCNITQGLHWYNAIDFSNGRCGEPVFAAAGGEIQRTGYHSVAGKYVRILHPNGVVTFYGHLSTILVVPGQRVSQGEIIGYTGNTGFTIGRTGCHLHFEVRGARNPFAG